MKQVLADLDAMHKVIGDPKLDLAAKIPWRRQTLLREALLVARHNAYHWAARDGPPILERK